MPLPGCSSPSFRRSRALAIGVFLLAARLSSGQQIETSLVSSNDQLLIQARLTGIDTERVLDSLHDGLETQVTFQFRYYSRPGRTFTLFGDRLLSEAEIIHSGSMDFFDGSYILDSDLRLASSQTKSILGANGRTPSVLSLSTPEEFIRRFLSIEQCELPIPAGGVSGRAYIMARARLDYVKLDPPLNIITLFYPTAATTEWQRLDITGE